MDFSALGSLGFRGVPAEDMVEPGAMDSITLGQLRAAVGSGPKPKPSYYTFSYDDEHAVFNEIEEFYSYVEVPQFAENLKAWGESFGGEWTKCTFAERKTHVEALIDHLEHRDTEARFTSARRLLYVLQGTFAETTSPEHQLHWIIENCKVVRAANGLSNIVDALKIASSKHDLLWSISERQLNVSAAEKHELVEEVNTEMSLYLGMLYLLIEVFKGDDQFGDELMSLEPPLPVYLFNLVSALKEKSTKGYPIKKLLLVLWKCLLACMGGVRELRRAKKLARELDGLPAEGESAAKVKSSPIDLQMFRQETSVKYPTFNPAQNKIHDVPTDSLASAVAPIPVRPHYHHQYTSGDQDSHFSMNPLSGNIHRSVSGQNPFPPQPHIATPAPSPPPSLKPKKQQYQTDQGRPFLFPFSRFTSKQRFVPFAIDEADKLYLRHIHVSLSLYQMWVTREEYILEESGLSKDTSSGSEWRRASIFSEAAPRFGDEEEADDLPSDLKRLDEVIAEAEAAMTDVESNDNRGDRRRAKERRDDLVRLRRAEALYSGTLPSMQGWVIVLLKLLLATVTAATVNSNAPPSNGFPPGINGVPNPPMPPPTLEDIDVMRHREITTKSVSAILLLSLQWFKVSHVMKFHQLAQLLLDSNCLLLILKMFGMQEVSMTVTAKNDSPEHNFFRYCHVNFTKNGHATRPEDFILSPPRVPIRPSLAGAGFPIPENEEVELLDEFSWRNFFTSINFVKIMQKLSKHRPHRIWLLTQYKSSAILKRVLRVSHPLLQLYVLKLIKSQVPFCGRKWRQTNMKLITSIYLNCRPDLRDEWLTAIEVDEGGPALGQEQALRSLVKFYNIKRYGPAAVQALNSAHRRSSSQSVPGVEGLGQGPDIPANRSMLSPRMDPDIFPPLRSQAPDQSPFLPYTTEDSAFEEEYQDYLSEFGDDDVSHMGHDSLDDTSLHGSRPLSAWQKLADFTGDLADGISDSESIAPIGELDVEGLSDPSFADPNKNNWEHLSPKTLAAMPKSPAGGARRTSSGSGLRPVVPFGLDDGSAIDDDLEDEHEMGPMLTGRSEPFAAGEGGRGVDEVEFMYGE